MSLSYAFTDHETIQITCDGQTIEVTIPRIVAGPTGAQPSGTTAPTPPPVSGTVPAGAAGAPTGNAAGDGKKKRILIPIDGLEPVYPGTMLITAEGKTPVGGEIYSGELPDHFLDLSDITGKSDSDILSRATELSGLRIIDLLVDQSMSSRAPEMRRLKGFLDDPSIELDALRIWTK